MEEKKILAQIKTLRQIKPNQQWVCLTKSRVLGAEALRRSNHWPRFSTIFCSNIGWLWPR